MIVSFSQRGTKPAGGQTVPSCGPMESNTPVCSLSIEWASTDR